LCAFDLVLKFVGVHLGPVGRGEERAHLVGRPVERRRLAGCGAVEEVHEGPAEILGIGFRRCRRTAQEIRPDRVERLDHGLAFGKVGARYGSWTDREAGEIEAGELVGE
jgi:hypothetical protein